MFARTYSRVKKGIDLVCKTEGISAILLLRTIVYNSSYYLYMCLILGKSVNNSLLVSIATIHAPGSVDENYSTEEGAYCMYY